MKANQIKAIQDRFDATPGAILTVWVAPRDSRRFTKRQFEAFIALQRMTGQVPPPALPATTAGITLAHAMFALTEAF